MGHVNSRYLPTLGLTPVEKHHLERGWDLVCSDIETVGNSIFLVFLNDFPEHRKYFPFSEGKTIIHKELKRHGKKVMTELGYLVSHIHSAEPLLKALHENADSHRGRDITLESYDDLKASILKTFNNEGGNRFDLECLEAWDKALTIMFKIITDINEGAKCGCSAGKYTNFPRHYTDGKCNQ